MFSDRNGGGDHMLFTSNFQWTHAIRPQGWVTSLELVTRLCIFQVSVDKQRSLHMRLVLTTFGQFSSILGSVWEIAVLREGPGQWLPRRLLLVLLLIAQGRWLPLNYPIAAGFVWKGNATNNKSVKSNEWRTYSCCTCSRFSATAHTVKVCMGFYFYGRLCTAIFVVTAVVVLWRAINRVLFCGLLLNKQLKQLACTWLEFLFLY